MAYAKLEFPTFDIYIQKLSVLLGRRPAAPRGRQGAVAREAPAAADKAVQSPEVKIEDFVHDTDLASKPAPVVKASSPGKSASAAATPTSAAADEVADIDLGSIRAISRHHARVFFDTSIGQWAIGVIGRNGVVIDDRWHGAAEVVPLDKRCVAL